MSEDTEQPGPPSAAGEPEASATPTDNPMPGEPATHEAPTAPLGQAAAAGGPPPEPTAQFGTAIPMGAGGATPPPPPPSDATPPLGQSGLDQAGAQPPPPPQSAQSWAPPAAAGAAQPSNDPFAYPPPPPGTPMGTGTSGERKSRVWLPVALIAALIGALVGAGVTALADNSNNSNAGVTVNESGATPGAAVLSGNVTIPQLVSKVIPAVVSIDVKSQGNEDEGTGMIISSDGEVITNNHVIELFVDDGNTGTITVTEYGQTKALATTLIGYDQTKDVALLKINNASNLPTVTFGNSSKAVVGDAVVAIGNALGLAAGTPTVTQGIVSALGRSVTAGGDGTASENLQNLIQTDAAINPGNSGGPLIDTSGQVIAMNTAVAGTSGDGTSSQNIGFAIPIAQVESLLPQLEKGGQSGNAGGYLGVDITTLTAALRQQYGFTPTQGAVVLSVVSGSPADKAGLVQGDVIVDINGTPITSAETLQNAIQKSKSGEKVTITYYVGDNKRTTTATLGSQSEEQQQSATGGSTTNPFGGGGFPGFGNSGGTGSTGSTGNTGNTG